MSPPRRRDPEADPTLVAFVLLLLALLIAELVLFG